MLNRVYVSVALIAITSVAFANPPPSITLDDAKYYSSSLWVLMGIEPENRGAVAAGACADIPACADGCGPFFKLIPGSAYLSAEKYNQVLTGEALCEDSLLKRLISSAASHQQPSDGRLQQPEKRVRQLALDRFGALYERLRPVLEPADQEDDDCVLRQMNLRSIRLDHACKPHVTPQYTNGKVRGAGSKTGVT